MSRKKDHFLHEVTNHIRSKEAKEFVATELEHHLKEVKKEWMEKGLCETEAEEKAVMQMGSPAKLGRELNKLHRPRVDWWLIGLLIITMGLSFLPLFSFGDINTQNVVLRKSVIVLLGVVAAVGMMFYDYRKLASKGWLFYFLALFGLLLITFFSNYRINGALTFAVGPFRLQSFMVLPFLYLAWSSFYNDIRLKIWHLLILYLLPLYLIALVPDLSTMVIYTAMVYTMLWWSTISRKNAVKITVGAVILGAALLSLALATAKEYQLGRLYAFIDAKKYPNTYGYMYLKLREQLTSAGWFGSMENSQSLPNQHTDFVFAGLTHQYGYAFGFALLLILSLFAVRILLITNHVQNPFGRLLLVGGITLYLVQFGYNIGMILGWLPLTSMSLPFISYGLMPTLLNAFIIGTVLSVSKHGDGSPASFQSAKR
ncbi:FtsW/RodA/SpoVE family cell cycle protein [Bacillus sp. REN3]|uniref:FtsW/RodA/SpoVE family cell cycle protein n=1 Tax=Bacillus sp. REN3 TaxID=2802440 RepID=UPI001AEE85F3